MNVTPSQAREAETFAREQRMMFAPLMRVDISKVSAPHAIALCSRVAAVAESDPMKWDEMLKDAAVNALFGRGALYFGK
jgi:hypothetical protein